MARKKRKNNLDPVVIKGVSSIILIVLSVIITLSFFSLAGEGGKAINNFLLGPIFGMLKYTLPFFLLFSAWAIVKGEQYEHKTPHSIGIILFFVATSGLFHMNFELGDMWLMALEGEGGGLLGMSAWALKNYFGPIATIVLFLGLLLVSIILTFKSSVEHILKAQKKAGNGFQNILTQISQGFNNLFIKEEMAEAYQDNQNEIDQFQETDDVDDYEEPERDFDNREIKTETSEVENTKQKQEDIDINISDNDDVEIDVDQPDYMQNVIEKKIPPLSLLANKRQKPSSQDIKKSRKTIQKTLEDFGVEVDMGEVKVGPTVTQFTFKPPKGVKLSKITNLSDNLALSLAAHPLRIEAPIPGKSLVGIEVPNETTAQVSIKELLQSKQFKKRDHDMMIALGKDVAGKVWFADLPRMPHLLIAGATGSGKTVCINTIIMSLIYQNTAETLRFIMVDPKRVELNHYDGIPHLLTPVITKASKAVNALEWAVNEMERRFDVLSEAGCRDIKSYNKKFPDKKMPNIVFIIDELADLMQAASNEIEAGTIRLAQMARAVGIHLILATQRPSVDVITGLMKANIPGRISFSVASATDSRVILDEPGAERLVGKGDMLLSTAELSKPKRIQGAFISEKEVNRVIEYLKVDDDPEYDESIVENSSKSASSMFEDDEEEKDELYEEAKKTVLKAGKGSSSYLQRKLRIGYSRAARILDQLHEEGIVGPPRNSKPREIALTEEEVVQELNPNGSQNVYKNGEDNEDGEKKGEDNKEKNKNEPENQEQKEGEASK